MNKLTKNLGCYHKVGRPPKNWKPTPSSILIVHKGRFVITFQM